MTVNQTNPVTLSCLSDANPPTHTHTWRKDGSSISETGSTYTIASAQVSKIVKLDLSRKSLKNISIIKEKNMTSFWNHTFFLGRPVQPIFLSSATINLYKPFLMKGIGPKCQSYFFSGVLQCFLCYSYLSDSTLRTSSFAQFLLFQPS